MAALDELDFFAFDLVADEDDFFLLAFLLVFLADEDCFLALLVLDFSFHCVQFF